MLLLLLLLLLLLWWLRWVAHLRRDAEVLGERVVVLGRVSHGVVVVVGIPDLKL